MSTTVKPLTVVTIDDEPLALRRLELILGGMDGVRHMGAASSCSDAVSVIAKHQPDVVLLDVRLRDGTGFDILDNLAGVASPAVVFVTAFDHFAAKAFEVAAADYLLKPIEPARLREAFERAAARISTGSLAHELDEMRAIVRDLRAEFHSQCPSPYDSEVWIRSSSGTLTRVRYDEVEWVGSEEDYVRLHTGHGSYLLRISIKSLESRIDPATFVRVHRAALVRLEAIAEVRHSKAGGREVILRDGTRLPAGRVYAKRLRDKVKDAWML